MISHLRFQLGRVLRSLWFTPAVYALVAIGILLLAPLIAPILPRGAMDAIGLEGVYDLLDVLASSLLAVAIFSLGIMASSMQAAASAATPRARPLMMEDRSAQNAISTFIGGFIFAIVGMVGLSTNFYSDAAKVLLFAVTCLVILAVIVSLIRWIGRLSNLGDVSEVVGLVEGAASKSFEALARDPCFGGRRCEGPPEDGVPVMPDRFGFVQAVSGETLGRIAKDMGTDLHLAARPGAYVDPDRPLLIAAGPVDDEAADRIRGAFVLGSHRAYEADPRFGLIVLSEIASRALSSGVNDPGTAIDVVGTLVRVLARWSDATREAEPELRHDLLHVPPLEVDDVFEDAFRWIARDAAGMLEVHIRIQNGLATLAAHDADMFAAPARTLSQEALARAENVMKLPQDIDRLRAIARQVQDRA